MKHPKDIDDDVAWIQFLQDSEKKMTKRKQLSGSNYCKDCRRYHKKGQCREKVN